MTGSYGASLVIRAIGLWAIMYGVLVNIGGPSGWDNPAYNIANLMPGSPYTWGVILLVGGLLVMYGSLTDQHLPFRVFSFKFPTFVFENYKTGWCVTRIVIDWGSEQLRNIGLRVISCWLLFLSIAIFLATFQVPDTSLYGGSKDVLLSVICIVMTKVKEPKK